jgi:hypothetical protein
MSKTARPVRERFYEKFFIDISTGCWIWTGPLRKDLYGYLKIDGRSVLAHRVSYELHNGNIPSGLEVCHTCDNPSCVSPNHLFCGTHDDNMKDMASKGRGKTIARHGKDNPMYGISLSKGSDNGMSKLTEENVRFILKSSMSDTELGKMFGVLRGTVWAIRTRKSWKHIDE